MTKHLNSPRLGMVALTALIGCSPAVAAYDSERLGDAVGGYLMATDLMEKFSKTECGYIVKKRVTFKAALDEVLPYLSGRDRKELLAAIQSGELDSMWAENDENVRVMIYAAKQGTDPKTGCGVAFGITIGTYQRALQTWNYAKANYAQ